MASAPYTTADDRGSGTTISAIPGDIIRTSILPRLDGQTLAAAACTSTEFHSLSTDQQLWRDICLHTWPSLNDASLRNIISTLPFTYRSFFSDCFPVLDHRTEPSNRLELSSFTSTLISAVDIKYKEDTIFSKVQETDTVAGWFMCSPFRIELLKQKECVLTQISRDMESSKWVKNLEDNLSLSWIIIDPKKGRAMNVSSGHAVRVERHWLTGEVEVEYVMIMAAERRRRGSKWVECRVTVTCGEREGGKMEVREVNMVMEDMDGKGIMGKEGLLVLEMGIEKGMRRREKGIWEERERYVGYLGMKSERKVKIQRLERALDVACFVFGVSVFVGFWGFILFR